MINWIDAVEKFYKTNSEKTDVAKIFLVISLILLHFIGLLALFSVSGDGENFAYKQLTYTIFFSVLCVIIYKMDISFFYRNAYILYFCGVLLLLIAHFMGYKAMGAQRWIRIGPVNIQPSEFMKIFVVLAIARFYHERNPIDVEKLSYHVPTILLTIIPFLIILKQPNLGTATITLALGGILILLSGIGKRYIIFSIIAVLSLAPIVWYLMHDYQKMRVLMFLNPQSDALGAGYNIIQSMISIGSGGLLGKGFMQGTQSQLNFLPEKHTDFILSVICEEFGFIGLMVVMMLVLIILSASYVLAFRTHNQFNRMVILGVASMFFMHVIINSFMISGLMPVVGITFPLISYGGSNLGCFIISFGLLLNSGRLTN